MKKIVIASAVSALFAAPATVLAQAKPPAAPTLDKVLEASGISMSGYIDAGYTYANKNIDPAAGGFSTRVFDTQNNSFGLNQFGLTVAKQPKEGFGGLVNLTVGRDAQFIHSFPETSGATSGSSMFDVTQGFLQYASGPLTVIAGKFTTLHGTEVIASTGNTNISRSMLFGAVPFTHTGVRATWALSDTVSLIGGVNNGWDQLTDSNKGKTLELGATLNPIKPLSIVVSGYSGQESVTGASNPGGAQGTRTSLNAVASYTIMEPLSVGAEILSVSQDNAGGTGTTAKYNGIAGYVTYMFAPKLRGVVRVESFDDKNGFHFAPAAFPGTDTKYREVTATASFLASDSFEARAEVRRDQATNSVFSDSGGTSKSMMSAALQGLYKF
ncbi:MAG TPA: outer membrane beta-barrel protein [Burkholderiales bacterium]|nr:outer membrane beta-barrel protein [Burkholderiales bacterium]